MTVGDLVQRVYGYGTGFSVTCTCDLGILLKLDETNGIAYVYWCEKQTFLWTMVRKLAVI